ncbi:hypothetical protein C1H46_003881 [Malus baccata]|uniref:Uncharacterized protein n=1 Tax=Malus baccata TaxID=106549 RepID=A0A540NIV6_MALBA|nr:hypothetical protein C1H46_003881 [Malus baccata]
MQRNLPRHPQSRLWDPIQVFIVNAYFTVKKNIKEPCRQLKIAKLTCVVYDQIKITYDHEHHAVETREQHNVFAHNVGSVKCARLMQ